MRISLKHIVCALCVVVSGSAWAISHPETPTLTVGEEAPMVKPLEWLRGGPVTRYESGRVYVVEFWATWCPPCIKAIPHLSELQSKYADKLTIISVNADGVMGGDVVPADVVHKFMSKFGKDMRYTVAMEDPVARPMSEGWVAASGCLGAPTAFIINQAGKLVWIGYSNVYDGYTFDQALVDTMAGTTDLVKARALQDSTSRDTAKYWADKSKSKP